MGKDPAPRGALRARIAVMSTRSRAPTADGHTCPQCSSRQELSRELCQRLRACCSPLSERFRACCSSLSEHRVPRKVCEWFNACRSFYTKHRLWRVAAKAVLLTVSLIVSVMIVSVIITTALGCGTTMDISEIKSSSTISSCFESMYTIMLVFALLSLLGCLFMFTISAIVLFNHMKECYPKPLLETLTMLALCDAGYACNVVVTCCSYFSGSYAILNNFNTSLVDVEEACVQAGVADHFFAVSSISWDFIATLYLFLMV